MIVAFYDDSVKTTTLLTSQNFKISDRGQTPDVKGSSDRTIDGTLKSWEIYRRYEEELSIDHLKPAGWTIIKGWIDNSTAIYYCPDTTNRSTELYNVKIAPLSGNPSYDQFENRYSIDILIREI